MSLRRSVLKSVTALRTGRSSGMGIEAAASMSTVGTATTGPVSRARIGAYDSSVALWKSAAAVEDRHSCLSLLEPDRQECLSSTGAVAQAAVKSAAAQVAIKRVL